MAKKILTFREKLNYLGFRDYPHYQRSKLWKSIRRRVFALRGSVCQCCKTAPARVVHHTEYSLVTLQGLVIETLQPVCKACHDDIHGRGPDGINKFKLAKEPRLSASAPSARKKAKKRREKKAKKKLKVAPIHGTHRAYVALQKASASPPKPKQPLPTKYCLSCLSLKETRRFAKHPQTGAAVCCDCLDKLRSNPAAKRTQHGRINHQKRRVA